MSARLILEIDIGKLLAVVVAHDEAGVVVFLDRPRRWETASYWHYRISFHSVSLLLAGESHRKSYSDVARPTVVPSVGMIAQVLYNHG